MRDGWIQRQIETGKKDDEIEKSFVNDGWTTKDAQNAIISAHNPPTISKMPALYMNLFFAAIIGWLILIIASPNILNSKIGLAIDYSVASSNMILSNVIIPSVGIIGAIVFFAYILYQLAIKHHHPKLHAIFCLVTASITASGLVAWFLVGTRILLGPSIYISTTIIIMSVSFGIYVAAMEIMYHNLRNVFDKKEFHLRRSVIVAICAMIISFILLVGITYYAEQKVTAYADNQLQQMDNINTELSTRLTALQQESATIPNLYLQNKINTEIQAIQNISTTTYVQQGVVQDFFNDRLVEGYVTTILRQNQKVIRTTEIVHVVTYYSEFKAWRMSDRSNNVDLELYQKLSSNSGLPESVQQLEINQQNLATIELPLFRPKFIDTHIIELKEISNRLYSMNYAIGESRIFPENPDINDPDQREMVQFRTWMYHKIRQDRK